MGAILGVAGRSDLIGWWDFEFDRVEVPAVTPSGTTYRRRLAYGMPRIPPAILDSTFYLYSSKQDAIDGAPFGGTGVFIGMPTGIENTAFVYAVANWHVAVRDGHSVIRFNRRNGGVEIFELDPSEWEFPPGGPDIAVANRSDMNLNGFTHKVTVIPTEMFARRVDMMPSDPRLSLHRTPGDLPPYLEIGAGEDIFMVGRFVDHDGKDTNVPSVRFGNISVMPQRVEQPNGFDKHESFLLDLHSRSGYSGSPVFVYRTMGSDLTHRGMISGPGHHFIKFLGLHWGQFDEKWPIGLGVKLTAQGAPVPAPTPHVKGMSGMTLAVPAWDILDYLQMPKFQQDRAEELEKLIRDRGLSSVPVAEVAEKSASLSDSDENLQHREDFTSLLSAAAKTKPQGD